MNAFWKLVRGSFFWTRILPDSWVIGIATLWFGRSVKAPGTWGSLAGLLFYTVFFARSHWLFCAILGAVSLYVAAALCDEAEKRLHQTDPGAVILDEVVAMPLVYLGLSALPQGILPYWAVLLMGFALFRLFDIVKPFGIARLQRLPGGIGVVADDVAAGLASCVVLHLGIMALVWWQGAHAAV